MSAQENKQVLSKKARRSLKKTLFSVQDLTEKSGVSLGVTSETLSQKERTSDQAPEPDHVEAEDKSLGGISVTPVVGTEPATINNKPNAYMYESEEFQELLARFRGEVSVPEMTLPDSFNKPAEEEYPPSEGSSDQVDTPKKINQGVQLSLNMMAFPLN